MLKKKRKAFRKLFIWCLLVCGLVFSTVTPVFADMGPKPSVTLMLKNAPRQFYCVALLTKGEWRPERESEGDGATGIKEQLKEKVFAYEQDGWVLSYSRSGYEFMSFSDQSGYGTEPSYSFSYYAPSHFKVLILAEDGTEYVSNEITTTRFAAQCIYDVETGALTEDLEAYQKYDRTYVVVALKYLLGTLLVEGLLLILFRLNQARNLPIFFIANILTQIYLHVGTWRYNISHGGGLGYLGKFLGMEFLIILAEMVLYGFFMKQKNEKHGRCIVYAIVANLVSALSGLIFEVPISSSAWFFIDLAIFLILLIAFSLDTKRNLVMAVLIHIGIYLISYLLSMAITKLHLFSRPISASSVRMVTILMNGVFKGFYIAIRSLGCALLLQTKDGSKGTIRKVAYAMVTDIIIWVLSWIILWANVIY